MAGVHGLEHVQRFAATALSDDDPVGPHTQGVDDQLANGDTALAANIRGTGLKTADVLLVELQLCRILDGDDPLVDGDESRADVEQRRLTRTGTTGDQDVRSRKDAGLDKGGRRLVSVPK